MSVVTTRYTDAGDEAGTAPEDRRFRPDVQGPRAVAILLVVLYHAAIPGVTGGYVGVDVFFVISGFVITGVLLRERVATGRTSIVSFYGRRARRIIPAASLVIIVTVIAHEQMNDLFKRVAARHPDEVAVVNLDTRVCPSGPPRPFVVTGFDPKPTSVWQALRSDGLHYVTPESSLWVAKWLVPQIAAASRGISR